MIAPVGERRDALRAAADDQVQRWETALADRLDALWDRQQGVVLARLTGTKARKGTRHWSSGGREAKALTPLDPWYILDPARWLLEAVNGVRDLIRRLFRDVLGRVLGRFGMNAEVPPGEQPPVPPEVVESAVDRRLEQIARGVATAVEEVQQVIAERDVAGNSMPDIERAVRVTYAQRRPTWSQRIVTTNVVGAMNEAALSAAVAAGVTEKQWLAAHDSRVRDTHVKADGQVVAITDRFRLGGFDGNPESTLAYPGDPTGLLREVIACRCTMLFPMPRQAPYDPSARGWKALNLDRPGPAGADPAVAALIASHGVEVGGADQVIAVKDARGHIDGWAVHSPDRAPVVWVHRSAPPDLHAQLAAATPGGDA